LFELIQFELIKSLFYNFTWEAWFPQKIFPYSPKDLPTAQSWHKRNLPEIKATRDIYSNNAILYLLQKTVSIIFVFCTLTKKQQLITIDWKAFSTQLLNLMIFNLFEKKMVSVWANIMQLKESKVAKMRFYSMEFSANRIQLKK